MLQPHSPGLMFSLSSCLQASSRFSVIQFSPLKPAHLPLTLPAAQQLANHQSLDSPSLAFNRFSISFMKGEVLRYWSGVT